MMLLLLFGSFFLLLALGVPILFSMGVSAGVYYVVSGYPLMQFVQKTIGGSGLLHPAGHPLLPAGR